MPDFSLFPTKLLLIRYLFIIGISLLVGSPILLAQQIDYKGFPEWSWHREDSTEYYLYTPSNRKAGEKYPVALFLHGCCGTSYKATLRNTVDPPVRMWHNFGENIQKIPTYIIAPATSRGWSQHIPNLKKVIDSLIESGNADPQRIYITGFSMGAEGTWQFLNRYPNYFAAAIPMGMGFSGDMQTIKDIPIWTIKGETDYYGRTLNRSVDSIRMLRGYKKDTSAVWETGVNPRLTVFPRMGHGVQWAAASKLELTDWAYSRINDGNKYPTVYFNSPAYDEKLKDDLVPVQVEASDPDGVISKVEIVLNGKLIRTLSAAPFHMQVKVPTGESKIEARAYDDKGKYNTAITIVSNGTNTTHKLSVPTIPQLGWDSMPPRKSTQSIGGVKITEVRNHAGKPLPVSVVHKGGLAHGNRSDDEVTFSETGNFEGLTLIQTDVYDSSSVSPHLGFTVHEAVTVYIAYEKKDSLHTSTVPSWLANFRKVDGPQIVTQYYYYDVYAKRFPKGRITLPDAAEQANRVSTNYFVMVGKDGGVPPK